jgi:hypothetical protein
VRDEQGEKGKWVKGEMEKRSKEEHSAHIGSKMKSTISREETFFIQWFNTEEY